MNQDYSLLGILKTLSKWIKPIIYGTLAITILSGILLFMMPNYYKASTTFYAASPDLSQPAPIGGQGIKTYVYGDDTDLDRLFSLAGSSDVYDFLIEKHDLYNHYEIDPNSRKAEARIRLKLNKLYQTLKTEYGAISLSIEDVDPMLARDIANDAREKINELSQKMVKESQKKTIESFKENISKKQIQSIILNDSLSNTKERFDIFDSGAQGEIYAELLTKRSADLDALGSKLEMFKNSRVPGARDSVRQNQIKFTSNEKMVAGIKEKATKYVKGISIVRKVELELSRLNDQISLDKERMLQLEGSYNAPFSALLIVEEAAIPADKSRPRRSILLLMIGAAAFLFSILAAFLIDGYKKINWAEIKA